MNTKKNLLAVVLFSMMILPVVTKAQTVARPAAHSEAKAVTGWQPVQLASDGKNAIEGVQFFSQKSECGGNQSTLLKLVNGNASASQVTYQISAESPVVTITLSPSVTLEGSCSAKDANLTKLNIVWPTDKTADEIAKMKGYLMKHIFVSKA